MNFRYIYIVNITILILSLNLVKPLKLNEV